MAALWLFAVAVSFRRSYVVLIGGLSAIGLYALVSLHYGQVSLAELGMSFPLPWLGTIGYAFTGLLALLAVSPLADRVATAFVKTPPTLGAFRSLQESRLKLLAGIAVAWILGAFLEELVFRGIILRTIEAATADFAGPLLASGIAILCAAFGAGIIHLYQGLRAAIIITQLSVLFGVVFVVSGHNLWAVMLCHGLYDTIAFVRFANKTSRYAKYASES